MTQALPAWVRCLQPRRSDRRWLESMNEVLLAVIALVVPVTTLLVGAYGPRRAVPVPQHPARSTGDRGITDPALSSDYGA